MTENKPSMLRTVSGMMISPGATLKTAVTELPWFLSLSVSALAFLLFFAQTGLDLYRTGQQSMLFAIAAALTGAAFGAVVIPAFAVFVWVVTKAFGGNKTIKWTISAFCLSYSGALVYCIFGIIASIVLNWHTAVAFGVTGVLWAIGPMISTIREIVGGKIYLCVILATAAGCGVLFCWSFIGRY